MFGRRTKIVLGAGIVIAAILVAIFAPYIAPYDPLKQDLLSRLMPPAWAAKGSLARGSVSEIRISTSRFARMMAMLVTKTAAITTGASRWKMLPIISRPIPGQAKIVSVMTEPPTSRPS